MSRISFRLMTAAAAGVLFMIASVPAFPDSHVRFVRLSYVEGDVQVECDSGITEVKNNQTAGFDLSAKDQAVLTKNVEKQPYDNCDKQQSEFHTRYARHSYNSYSPYTYGVSDMNYYGNFFNAPG